MFSATKKNQLKKKLREISFIRKWLENKDIHIHKQVFKEKTSRIKIKWGGAIWIDEKTEILDGVIIYTYGGKISIGKNCSINPYAIIYGHGGVTIGDNVLIAAQCMIIAANHNFVSKDIPICFQGNNAKGITIEDDVWLGHGCSILDGVTIGRGAIIGAGSVINKSVPPFTIVAGVPAKVIRTR